MQEIFGIEEASLASWMEKEGEPGFRAGQVLQWVYRKKCKSFEAMTNVGKELRLKLEDAFCFSSIEAVRTTPSSDGETFKTLWRLKDGNYIESVLILSKERKTVCVSSQVGCPARCAFCASGKEGFFRNLSVAEIVEQVFHYEGVTNIVFMGMGEPLENYASVVQSIRLLTTLGGFSHRRITVSTVGVIEGIKRLSEEDLKVNLVLSLHAPNQKIRQKLIPYARKYALEDILQAMDLYAEKTKRDLTFEYTLISGINDEKEHAEELADLLKDKQCTVNLIPYNPVLGLRLERPSFETVMAFRSVLERKGIIHTCRYTKGDDIAAACGQLALQKKYQTC